MRTFERAYSILFGKSAKNIAVVATLLLALLATIESLAHPLALLYYAVFTLAMFAVVFITERNVVNPRRAYYVSAVSATATALFDVLFKKPPLAFALIGASIVAVVLQSLKCKSPAFLAPLFTTSVLYHALGFAALAVATLLYAAVIYGIKPVINKMAGGLDAMCLFSSFIYAVFAEDDVIEDAFRELGTVERVPLHLYVIGGRHVVVVSDFHPGPFRHIGGGMLVDILNREVEKLGFTFTFLHGVGSHERDPVSQHAVSKIVNAVKDALHYMQDGAPASGVAPTKVVVGDVKLVGFSLGTLPHLAVVSRVDSATDDIPLWVARRVEGGMYVLVDAQNRFDGVVRWREADVENLAEAIKALHEAPRCGSFEIGVGKASAEHIDPLGLEIGPAGVSAIAVTCDGRRGLLIVFDGNNLDGQLYDELVKRYGSRYDVVEIATTDTHRSTGVGFGKGYRVVGERLSHRRILEVADRAVKAAEASLGPHRVSYRRLEVEAEVLGELGFQRIQRAVRVYKRVGALIVFVIFVLPLVVISLLA